MPTRPHRYTVGTLCLGMMISLVLTFMRRRHRLRPVRTLKDVSPGSMLVFVRKRRVLGIGPYVEHTAIYVGGPNCEVIEISDDGHGKAVLLRRPVIETIRPDDQGLYVYSYPKLRSQPGALERAVAEWEAQRDARDYCFRNQNCQHWCSRIVYGSAVSHTKQLCLWLLNPLFRGRLEVCYEPIAPPEPWLRTLPTRSPVAGPLHTVHYVRGALRLHRDVRVLRTALLANEARWMIALLAAKRYNVVGQAFAPRERPYDSLQAVVDVAGARVDRLGVRVKMLHLMVPMLTLEGAD